MSLDEERQSRRPYRYGLILLCAGALVNWLGLAWGYANPVRYAGVTCIVIGALLTCAIFFCWRLARPPNEWHSTDNYSTENHSTDNHSTDNQSTDNDSIDSHQIDHPIYVISIPDDETMQQNPPDYDSVAGALPTYDDAIKLNASPLLPASSSVRHELALITIPVRRSTIPEEATSPSTPQDNFATVHRSRVPRTPPPSYIPTHTIR